MGKKSKKSPDYQALSEQDFNQNLDVQRNDTYANRANQYGPDGSLEWTTSQTIDPSTGKPVTQWNQTTSLSPELQKLYDSDLYSRQNKADVAGMATDRLLDDYSDPMDWSNRGDFGTVAGSQSTNPSERIDPRYTQAIGDQVGDPNEFRQRGEDYSYENQMRRIDPQYEKQTAAMENRLRNQGLNPDDMAWKNQMMAMSNSYNDASTGARLNSAAEGRQESALNFGQDLSRNQNIYNQELGSNAQNYGMDMSSNAQNYDQRFRSNDQMFNQSNTQFNQANALRQQQNQEMMTERGFGLNEANAMMSGGQVSMPTFGSYNTQYQGPQATNMEAGINQGNFDQAQSQGFWGTVGSLANSGMQAYGISQGK
tara:strand:+ start:82 stop:1185 length:1104 start_codon:yes stop_codon:yes gene_type:complete